MRFSLIILLLFSGLLSKAQQQEDQLIKELIENLAETLPEDYDYSVLEDRLLSLKKHPINLNTASAEELKGLFFLSPLQISNLFAHIRANGKLIDVLELQSIALFDVETVQKLLPFVAIHSSDLLDRITYANIIKFGQNDLVVRFGSVLEKPKGFTALAGSSYLGNRHRFLSRYKFEYSNRISAALIFEKDAGESFVRGEKQLLFDFQSAHLGIYHIGKFKKIILGDYTLQFGQGLTLWTGFAFGKSPDVASITKRDMGLKAYTSANEFSFLRGIASTVSLSRSLDFTVFFSDRNLDASLSLNANGQPVQSSFSETGLHRTATEIKNKNTLSQTLFGGVIQYQYNEFSVGLVAYQSKYGNEFITGSSNYTAYNFTGKHLTNVGLHYNYAFKNIYFFGEGAKSSKSGMAFLNGALISLSPKVSAVLLHRSYGKTYHNFFNQAMAEASEAVNENGFYAGLNITPVKVWTISFYADYFKFPWLKFRVDAPSEGEEVLGQVTYTPSKTFKAILRYKTELKQQNTDLGVPINYLEDVKKESYRLDVNWKFNRSIGFQNRIEVLQYKKGNSKIELGYLIYQDIAFVRTLAKISANLRLAYFHTPTFNSRIYAYEDDVLYNSTFGMYNGKGIRSYLNIKYKLLKKVDLWTRYALFWYKDLETIGSGLDEITGNKKTEVKVQLRYQF